MKSVNLANVLTTLNQIATVAPIIATATGLPTVGIVTDLGAALPAIETVLNDLLALFKKHAATIPANAAVTAPTPPTAA